MVVTSGSKKKGSWVDHLVQFVSKLRLLKNSLDTVVYIMRYVAANYKLIQSESNINNLFILCFQDKILVAWCKEVCKFIKEAITTNVSCEFFEVFQNSFFTEHLRATASGYYNKVKPNVLNNSIYLANMVWRAIWCYSTFAVNIVTEKHILLFKIRQADFSNKLALI